jgi:hypothetical protein
VVHATRAALADLPDGGFDDVLYTGAPPRPSRRSSRAGAHHSLLIALCGGRLVRAVAAPVGAVHHQPPHRRHSRPIRRRRWPPSASGEIAPVIVNVIGAGG